MDDADRASKDWERAMERFRLSRLHKADVGQTECECGNDIGKLRISHGFDKCIECAEAEEARQKQYR